MKTKLLLVSIFSSFAFWIPTWLQFAQYKNVELSTAYGIIALYSVLVVILEYPTGVIGDVLSHKASVTLGYIVTALASFVFVIATNVFSFTTAVVLLALGTSLISGSDQAYIKEITGEDHRKIYAQTKNAGLLATLVGITVGAYFFSLSPLLPMMANAVAFIISFTVILTLPKQKHAVDRTAGNLFSTAKKGIHVSITNKAITSILIIYGIIFAFSNNLKWLYGNILEMIAIPVSYWGILIAVFYLGRVVGIMLQNKIKGQKSTIALLVALANLVFLVGLIYNPILLPILIFVIMVIIGAVETDLEIELQEKTPSDIRSSVLSLRSLLGRGFAAIYIYFAGVLVSPDSVNKLTLFTFGLILFATGTQIALYIREKEKVEILKN